MTHAAMFYNGLGDGDLPGVYTEGIAQALPGVDDDSLIEAAVMKLALNNDKLKESLNMESGTAKAEYYTAGYMMMRYLEMLPTTRSPLWQKTLRDRPKSLPGNLLKDLLSPKT